MSILFLLRHGQASRAETGGQPGLTAKGRAQAASVGRLLRRLRGGEGPVLCSPALRCRETAEALAAGPVAVEPALAVDGPLHAALALADRAEPASVLVGHQPELLALLGALLGRGARPSLRLPPASLVGLERVGPGASFCLYLEPAAVEAIGEQA